MKILIIEDDKDISELLEYNLKQEKFACEMVANGASGLSKARRGLPDLIILDLMLPDMGGLDICRALKADEKTRAIPVLMLTAKGAEVDRIVGLEMGADDYLTKPVSPREVILRIKAILRRLKDRKWEESAKIFQYGILAVDASKFEVLVSKKEVKLTAIEFKLLQYLLSTKGRVATRDHLLDQVWGYEVALTTRTVDTHIKRLREKLGKAGAYIETIRGIGYRCRENPS